MNTNKMPKSVGRCKFLILIVGVLVIVFYIISNQYPSSSFWIYRPAPLKSAHKTFHSFHDQFYQTTNSKLPKLPILTNSSFSTDPTRTTFDYDKNKRYKVGDEFIAIISARNYLNQIKPFGGDFFQAVLYRTAVKGDGVAAKIVDHGNGSYSLRATLLWEGKTEIKIVLVQSREGVEALKVKTSKEHGDGLGFVSTVTFISEGKTVSKDFDCGPFQSGEVCNISGTLYDEPWFCVKPPSGCEALIGYQRSEKSLKTMGWRNDYKIYYMQKVNWQTPIKGSGAVIDVAGSTEVIEKAKLPRCQLGTIMKPKEHVISGQFFNGKWISNVCNNRQFTPEQAKSCLANSTIIIMGDSTARQFFEYMSPFLKLDQLKGNEPGEIYEKKSISKNDNIDLMFYVHGPPVQNPGEFSRKPYMSQTIHNLKPIPGKRLIILTTFGLHMLTFRSSYFRQRVAIFKKSIIELQKRIPEVRVIIKKINFHYEVINTHGLHQWLCYRMNKILEEELDGLDNAVLIDTWDMTLVQPPVGVHPEPSMMAHQSMMTLSYLCSGDDDD